MAKWFIDLYAGNPFKYDMGEKVMGYGTSGCFRFICGTIVDRKHQGETNAYSIESEYGKDFSGTLFENAIKLYDEKVIKGEKSD